METIKPEIRARIADRIVRGPFGQHVNFELVSADTDTCTVRLPFSPNIANGVGVIHGGVISALVDTCAVGAAWASPRNDNATRGATVGLTVNYLAPGLESDLLGVATIVRRGGSICIVNVNVHDTDARHIATGLVTYRLRQAKSTEETTVSVLGDSSD
jgi:uncharacterized protein (TIGR00369 family)